MPQLNPEFYLSQIFWLIVTFSFLFFILWKISLPRISSILEKRENKINNDIEEAKQLQTEAEEIQNQIDQKLKNTREKTETLIRNSTINLQNKSSQELLNLENKLNAIIDDSQKIIENNKKKSLKLIDDQIYEVTKLTISKLSSIKIEDKEIKKFVSEEQARVSL